MSNGFSKFECFYKSKRITVEAQSTYQAQLKASVEFKTKKHWDIAVVCVEDAQGCEVIHSTTEL